MKIIMSEASTGKGGHDLLLLVHPGSSIEQLAARWGLRSRSLQMRRLRFSALLAFRKVLRKERPDIIHVNSSRDSWLGAVAAQLVYPRIKVIKSRHISAQLNRNLPTRILYRYLFDH